MGMVVVPSLSQILPFIEKHFPKHGANNKDIQGALRNACARMFFVNMFDVECSLSCAFLKVFQAIL